jgi:hypothetical protein
MNKLNLMRLVVVLMLLTTSRILTAAEGAVTVRKSHPDFWKAAPTGKYSKFVKYANFPNQQVLEHKLATEDYKSIVSEFHRWTCQNLRPEYCPSEQALLQDISLIKSAQLEDQKEDVVYFGDIEASAGGEKAKIRVVQTGGVYSFVYFFIQYPDLTNKLDRATASELIGKSVDTFFKNADEIKKLIADISEENGVFTILKAPVVSWEYQFQSFQGFLHENVVCLYFLKQFYSKDGVPTPPNEPGRNEWFDWERKRQPQ